MKSANLQHIPWFNRIVDSIDALNHLAGKLAAYTVLAVVVLSVVTAVLRKLGIGSNALLEMQWYMFSLIFLLGSGYALQQDAHVRVSVLSQKLPESVRIWIDIIGHGVFLLPLCLILLYLSSVDAWQVFVSQEYSPDAGGLIRWPVKALIPLAFILLALQALAQLIRCVTELISTTRHSNTLD